MVLFCLFLNIKCYNKVCPHDTVNIWRRGQPITQVNMSNISVFQFESNSLEVVILSGEPWFNASQVAIALGYKNPSKALQDNVSAKYNQQLYLGRRGSNPNFISEPGLYQLVMRSTLPTAEKFQDWVFEEVLPSIRKNGSYSTEHKQAIAQPPSVQQIAEMVSVVLSLTPLDRNMIAASAANHIAKQYPALRPVAEDLKKELVIETPDRLLTPTELGLILEQRTGIKHTPQRVNKLLADNGLQVPNPNGKDPAWLPTPKGSEFSKLLLAAQKGLKDATRQRLQWYESVVDVLSR